MSWLGEKTIVLHGHTDVPGLAMISISHFRLVDHDGIEKTTSSNALDASAADKVIETVPKLLATDIGILRQFFITQNLKSGSCYLACERIAAIGRAVLTRLEREDNLIRSENCRNGDHASRQSLNGYNKKAYRCKLYDGARLEHKKIEPHAY